MGGKPRIKLKSLPVFVFTKWMKFFSGFFMADDRMQLIMFGAFVGICSGLAAFALNTCLHSMAFTLDLFRDHAWTILLPAGGAMLSAVFLEYLMREGAGHGVPEVVYSVSRYGGLLRLRSSYSRLISSCLTIGTGGSAGPEAPVVISGAAIGSNVAKLFSLNERQRITLVGCGSAGALAAIFNAPITGMVFTMEIIIGEWSAATIVPVAVASVAGAQLCRLLQGNQIAFTHLKFQVDVYMTLAAVGLAVLTAVVSILLARSMRLSHEVASRIKVPIWVKAGLGGLAVGCMGWFLPDVLGEGYHVIQEIVEGSFSPGLGAALLLVCAKVAATSLTLGWGGSGGIFAPCLVIGSFAGLAYFRLLCFFFPQASFMDPGCFGLLGMAGVVSGILQAPLTGMFLIVEITGGYETILPLILVSALSTTLSALLEPVSFYFKDLVEKGYYIRPRTDAKVLADLRIDELVETDCIPVRPDMSLREFIEVIKKSHRNYFPVVDPKTQKLLGLVHLDDIRPYLFDPFFYDTVFVEQIMETNVECVDIDSELAEVLAYMDKKRLFSMPVVANKRFVGMISKATLLDKYRKELMLQSVG